MTHADVPAIALSSLKNKPKELINYDKSKGFRLYTNSGSIRVYDNIFNQDNWQEKKEKGEKWY